MLTEDEILIYLKEHLESIGTEMANTCAFMDLRAYNRMVVRHEETKRIIKSIERLSRSKEMNE